MDARRSIPVVSPDGALPTLPAELLVTVFSGLDSLDDVLSLARTNTRFRAVWQRNTGRIFNVVGRRSLSCAHHARQLRIDQSGRAPDAPLIADDAVELLRNRASVENAISEFERKVVKNVRCGPLDAQAIYGDGMRGHPPNLTRFERIRFYRCYYQIWSLLLLDEAQWPARLAAIGSMKQLFYLHEFCRLPLTLEPPQLWPVSGGKAASSSPSERWDSLHGAIRERLRHLYRDVHGRPPQNLELYAMQAGFSNARFAILWDHGQGLLKEEVCGVRPNVPGRLRTLDKEFLWDYETDEELSAG